jgi:exo-1,4-beta-D-glucosaminidase
MPKVQLKIDGIVHVSTANNRVTIRLYNPSDHIAFFERVSVTKGKGGDEILPITYSDNYVTLFPGETVKIVSTYNRVEIGKSKPWLQLEGYNTLKEIVPIQ